MEADKGGRGKCNVLNPVAATTGTFITKPFRYSSALPAVAGTQEWGKEAVEMKPGTVIAIPEGVKHWHGAAKDSWFQHLTYNTHVEDGSSNEWLEPVTDDIYDKLK